MQLRGAWAICMYFISRCHISGIGTRNGRKQRNHFFYIWAFLVTKKQINLGILFQLNKCGGEIIFYGILRENTK